MEGNDDSSTSRSIVGPRISGGLPLPSREAAVHNCLGGCNDVVTQKKHRATSYRQRTTFYSLGEFNRLYKKKKKDQVSLEGSSNSVSGETEKDDALWTGVNNNYYGGGWEE